MKKRFTMISALAALLSTTTVFGQIESYQQAPDLGGDDYINRGASNGQGSAFVVGSSSSAGTAGGYDALLAEIDPNDGAVNWAKTYGGTGTDFGRTLLNDGNGNILVVGRTNSFGTDDDPEFGVIQIDASTGNVNWAKALGTDTTDYPLTVAMANDGGYIIGGYTQPDQRSSNLLIKMQTNGTVDWAKQIGSQWGNERVYDISALGSGEGYLLIGYTGLYGATWNEAMVTKLDDNGDIEAVFTLGATGTATDDIALRYADGEGSFYVAGNTRSFGVGVQDMFLAKFSLATGFPSLMWFNTYGGGDSEELTGIEALNDDGMILLSGNTASFGTAGDGLLIAADTTAGNVMLAYTYGSSDYDAINDLLPTDEGLLVVGNSNSFGSGQADAYLIKLGDAGATSCFIQAQTITAVDQTANVTLTGPPTNIGDFASTAVTLTNDMAAAYTVGSATVTSNELCLTTGINDQEESNISMEVFPVPTNNNLVLRTGEADTYQIRIASVDGKIIETNSFTGNRLELNLTGLDSGVYFLSVENAVGVTSTRIVKY